MREATEDERFSFVSFLNIGSEIHGNSPLTPHTHAYKWGRRPTTASSQPTSLDLILGPGSNHVQLRLDLVVHRQSGGSRRCDTDEDERLWRCRRILFAPPPHHPPPHPPAHRRRIAPPTHPLCPATSVLRSTRYRQVGRCPLLIPPASTRKISNIVNQ
jgi:hypothetical protein